MKKIKLLVGCMMLMAYTFYAQPLSVDVQLSAGSTLMQVNDEATSNSNGLDSRGYLRDPSDGETGKQKDGMALSAGVYVQYELKKGIGIFSGLHILGADFSLFNRDGNYRGTSTYALSYLQIPIGVSYLSPEITRHLKLYGRLGASFDLKLQEKLKGGDGAHYWNLATNNSNADPTRGRNGNGESVDLFAPVNAGILFSVGAEYKLADQLRPFLGFSINQGVSNLFNSQLLHNDVNKTPVTENLSLRLATFGIDLGLRF
ncbi:MAG: PorT family protein [Cytophagaceae bacterium]|jgi:hypothetical protein|nr:PorT family protein [Cytophagaceae bacterium]